MKSLSIAIAQVNPTVGDLIGNADMIISTANAIITENPNTDLIVFPECVTSGYPIEDQANRPRFMEDVRQTVLNDIVPRLNFKDVGVIFGTPWIETDRYIGEVYNAAILVMGGQIREIRYKYNLPNYGVFDEERVFTQPRTIGEPIEFKGNKIGLMICQDMWGDKTGYKAVPNYLGSKGVDGFIVINGSPYQTGKNSTRRNIATSISNQFSVPLLYVNLVGGQDELVFDGGSFLVSNDEYKLIAPEFEVYIGGINHDFEVKSNLQQDYEALMLGLGDYVRKNGFDKEGVVLGLSGGVDSTLVAMIAADALGPQKVFGLMMPSKYSSNASIEHSEQFAERIGIPIELAEIEESVAAFRHITAPLFQRLDIDGRFAKNAKVTDENLQARDRGVILMAVSNFTGKMLLTTGNKSEVSVGYSTLYGDMNGGFNPLKDVYKTRVFQLCQWRNRNIPNGAKVVKTNVIPKIIISKPPSAELSPGQIDSDSLPPYPVLDDLLEKMIEKEMPMSEIEGDLKVIRRVRRLIDIAEYKRRQSAPGTKISVKLHGNDRRYPITNAYKEA